MSRASPSRRFLALAAVVVLLPLTGCITGLGKGGSLHDQHIESGIWRTHLDLGHPEPDVYILRGGAGGLWRPTPGDLDARPGDRLYASSLAQGHDPTHQVTGPFPEGHDFDVTLVDWARATGAWAYLCEGGDAIFQATLHNLVPDGLYSIWVQRIKLDEGAVDATMWAPLGGETRQAFTASDVGDGWVRIDLDDCLPPSTVDLRETGVATQLALIHHSNGVVDPEFTGAFGKTAHVHLVSRLRGAVDHVSV